MLAAVAAGFASCSIREMGAPEAPANRIAVTVNASFDGTKTVFGTPADGKIPVSWSETGEILALAEISNGVRTQIDTVDAYSVENGGANAKFQFNLVQGEASSYDYVAVYPSSLFRAKPGKTTPAGAVFDFAFSVDPQTPTATSPDPSACLLFSKVSGLTAQPTELNMAFEHMCGYGKVSVKDVKLAAGETIESLLLQFPATDTTGARIGYMPDGSLKYETGVSSTLTIKTDNLETASGSFDAWFATRPFVFKNGENATVSIVTNKRTFKKEITATADLSFAAGVATAFAVDMSTAEAPEIFEADLELVFDFSDPQTTLPDWPTDKTANGEYVYPLNGTNYSFYLGATFAAAAQLTVNAAKSYLGLPVVKGHKLTRVVLNSIKGGTKYIGAISADTAGANIVKGGEQQTWTAAGAHTYTLEETVADTRYYVYGVGPLPINKITLYYDKDGEAKPEGPQPYDYPEVKGIDPVTCLFWGETYGGANSKPLTGALNYKKLEDGSGIEFIEEDHNYAVPGATLSVPGCTFFEVCSSAANKMFDTYALFKGSTADAPLPIFFSLPVKSALSGDLEFCCSINQGNTLLTKVTFEWSTDKTNWKNFDAVYSIQNNTPELAAGKTGFESTSNNAANNWAVCCFSIPEAEAIPVGGTFYVKAAPEFTSTMDATKTLRVNGGFMLLSKVQNTDFSASSNVIASRNFGDFWCGFQGMIGKPTRYFVSSYGNGANNKLEAGVADAYGWTPCGTFVPRRGYVWAQDNAEVAAYYQSPALAALTEPTDVMVTFKCCVFVDPLDNVHPDNFGVSVEGPGEVQELQKDSPAVPEGATHLSPEGYQWHKYYAVIKGATSETKVNVGKLTAITASRFYLDDIVITK